jgi:hypothetical protein
MAGLRARRTIDPVTEPDRAPAVPRSDGGAPARRPAAICHGPGLVVVYGNPAFIAAFGKQAVGVPARETLLDLPRGAFSLMDVVLERGKPLARWIKFRGEEWRMTAAPRRDPGTGEVYGVAFHLRARSDSDDADAPEAGEAPAGEAPAGEAPAGEAPAGEAPAGEAPAGEAPAGEAPAGEPGGGDAPEAGGGAA